MRLIDRYKKIYPQMIILKQIKDITRKACFCFVGQANNERNRENVKNAIATSLNEWEMTEGNMFPFISIDENGNEVMIIETDRDFYKNGPRM